MTSCRQLEIQFKDQNPQKWCHPLKEEAFRALTRKQIRMSIRCSTKGLCSVHSCSGNSLIRLMPFPCGNLSLLYCYPISIARASRSVDWFQTDDGCVLKAELPGTGLGNSTLQVCVEGGKVLEIRGEWRQHKDPKRMDWRSGHWWEHGYVRRLELPENLDWRKLEANVKNDVALEIKIPNNYSDSGILQAN